MSSQWLEWYYLIYLLPAAVAVFVLLASGFAGHEGGHADGADVHADFSMHGGAHFADGHAGHFHLDHHHAGHDGGGDTDGHSPGASTRLLGFFGVGRAPLTMVVGSLMIGWGLFGLGATELLREAFPDSLGFIPVAMAAATGGALLTAKVFGELTARLMPGDESFAIRANDVVGLTATVIYPVSDALGRVHVWDRNRTLHARTARLAEPGEALERGVVVLITGMDPTGRHLLVRSVDAAKPLPTAPKSA
jgi:hypothetical protein